jgi:hypothetical protein
MADKSKPAPSLPQRERALIGRTISPPAAPKRDNPGPRPKNNK